MSSRLNADILFEIGKKLIEDRNSEAAMKFAVSGKEPFEAMKRVFASVSTLTLYEGYCSVGWEKEPCEFEHGSLKPFSKFLMNQIGNCVVNLHIDCNNVEFYQANIDKIIEKKKLISFSVGKYCSEAYLDQFLPTFANTLKHITIPSTKMTETFRDTFNLESLIVLDYGEYDFSKFCCKTEKLEIQLSPDNSAPIFPHLIDGNNENRSSIKRIIYSTNGSPSFHSDFNALMENFSSLEVLQYNLAYFGSNPRCSYQFFIKCIMFDFMWEFFHGPVRIPSKIILKIENSEAPNRLEDLDFYKQHFGNYEYDESNKHYYSFCKTFVSADRTKSTTLELQFSK